jgi:hypothetical protein
VSRARLGSANGQARLGRPRALVVFEHERRTLLRALRALVEAEGASQTTGDLQAMLERAAPADVLAECEASA